MTNDYKENLLKYLTGNASNESKSNTPFLATTESNANSEIQTILSGFTYGYRVLDVLDCQNGYFVAYGNYSSSSGLSYNKGFLLILNSQMKPLEVLTQYNTGTAFGQFYKLRIDESGQLYGVDYSSSQFRVILLNNVSVKLPNQEHFVARLRNSYFFQGDIADCQGILDCVKSTQSAKYFICGRDSSTEILLATEFQINVGSANTWTDYTNSISLLFLIYLSTLIYYDDNDNVIVNIYFYDDVDPHPLYQIKNSGTTLTLSTILSSVDNYQVSNSTQLLTVDLLPIRANQFYLTITSLYRSTNTYIGLKTWLYDNGEINAVYTTNTTSYTSQQTPSGYIYPIIKSKLVGITPILTWGWSRSLTSNTNVFDYYITFLNSDVTILINTDIKVDRDKLNLESILAMSNTYNLFQFYLYYKDNTSGNQYLSESKVVYNENNYNGQTYLNKNSIAPMQGLLYDDNNTLIYARNMYNKKVFSNQTISTINEPNSMLNDIGIDTKDLYSETNTKIATENVGITKNIYEDLYINFISSITMQNQNTNIYIDNLSGATRLNTSSSKFLDYDKAKANKIRVTYDDDTYYITGASCTITDNVGTYTIGVHVPSDKNIKTIDIMSHDEVTIYQTIENLNLENNKYYIITQDVYVV